MRDLGRCPPNRIVSVKRLSFLLVLLTFLVLPTTADAAVFKNCTALNARYPNGVAKSRAAARKQAVMPRVSASIYRSHSRLDRDKDGTVCEASGMSGSLGPNTTNPGAATPTSPVSPGANVPGESTPPTSSVGVATTVPALTFTASATWGEISALQASGPSVGGCVEIPVTLDIRSQSGLSLGLIISAKDNYTNLIGESRPDTPLGIVQVPIKVCREAWTYTFPSGVASARAATLYCGVKLGFWPGSLEIQYKFKDSVCTTTSARLS
jgi:hypothetical protein